MYCKDCVYWKKNYVNPDEGMYCDYSAPWTEPCDHDWDISWYASDDSGLTMVLATKPMFGCVNFKAKEVPGGDKAS
jgi:hypothetical protein